jgi:hypothetical protein
MYEYQARFFDHVTDVALRSAAVLVPMLREQLPIESVVDLGCGEGAWLSVWEREGVADIVGVDGPYVERDALLIRPERFEARDLSGPVDLGRRFDLVQCLEVAEHLPPDSSQTLVDSLVAHGSLLLFSAAVPGQGGLNHINERSHTFWRRLFRQRGYLLLDFVRPRLVGHPEVGSWYRYNTFLFVAQDRLQALPAAVRESALPDTAAIPRVEPIATRLRTGLTRWLPQRLLHAMAHLKHFVLKLRPRRARHP